MGRQFAFTTGRSFQVPSKTKADTIRVIVTGTMNLSTLPAHGAAHCPSVLNRAAAGKLCTWSFLLSASAPPSCALAVYGGVIGAPGAGFGMRKVYTNPNTMVVPLGWALASYSFSYLKNTFQSCLRSI